MERRIGVLEGHAAVVLTAAVGLFSGVTGIATIGTDASVVPLRPVVPVGHRQAANHGGRPDE